MPPVGRPQLGAGGTSDPKEHWDGSGPYSLHLQSPLQSCKPQHGPVLPDLRQCHCPGCCPTQKFPDWLVLGGRWVRHLLLSISGK